MRGTALLFPGQGVQAPGMAGSLPRLRPRVFEEASEALGVDVVELCASGRSGAADLGSTRWAQPAIVAVGVAAAGDVGEVDAVAGHSVGEYAALVVAGAISLPEALRLVALRAELTEQAAARSPGSMAAVLGLDREVLRPLCFEAGAVIAADNAPGQLVVSGPHEAVERVLEGVRAAGGRCTRLNVPGPFHSPAMAEAVPAFLAALEEADLQAPVVPFFSSVAAAPVRDPDQIRMLLARALTAPVRWRETVLAMAARGIERFLDAGPGRVLANLVRRIVPEARTEEVAHAGAV